MIFKVFKLLFLLFFISIIAAEEMLDGIVAIVNNDVITLSELKRMRQGYEQELLERGKTIDDKDALDKQVLEYLISKKIQLQVANNQGIKIDAITLNKTVEKIAEDNGFDLQGYQEHLAEQGISFAKFKEEIREELILQELYQRAIANKILVTDQEVKTLLANQQQGNTSNIEYRISHIMIALPESTNITEINHLKDKAQRTLQQLKAGADFETLAISVSDGPQALEGGDLDWRYLGEIPSLFTDTVPKLKKGQISDIIENSSGYHIIKLVDIRGQENKTVTYSLLRHILVEDQKQANNLYKQIQKGADFAKLAKEYSIDPNSAPKGGHLGWVDINQIKEPTFAKMVKQIKAKQVGKPFKSSLGWHIVEVQDQKQENNKPLTEEEITNILRRNKFEKELANWIRQIRSESYIDNRLETF